MNPWLILLLASPLLSVCLCMLLLPLARPIRYVWRAPRSIVYRAEPTHRDIEVRKITLNRRGIDG